MGDATIQSQKPKFSYLDMLASVGFAKHIGGSKATDELIKKADIKPGSFVLDIGCGLGRTSCRLAGELGCTVVGIDLMPRMIEESKKRAMAAGVNDRVSFIRSDARRLPFKPDMFDTVIVESVTIFLDDVENAISGYKSVIKEGGYICDNEVCITRLSKEKLKEKVEDIESVFKAFSSDTNKGMLTYEDWRDIYESQFNEVSSKHYTIDPRVEAEINREEGVSVFRSMIKSMWLYMTNPEARKIMDESKKLAYYTDHFGYGLFVCKK